MDNRIICGKETIGYIFFNPALVVSKNSLKDIRNYTFQPFFVFSGISSTIWTRNYPTNHQILVKNLIFVEFYEFWSIFRLVLTIVILFWEKETTGYIFHILEFVDSKTSSYTFCKFRVIFLRIFSMLNECLKTKVKTSGILLAVSQIYI
mgnify:FL=1